MCYLENHELPTTSALLCFRPSWDVSGHCSAPEEDKALEQDLGRAASRSQIANSVLRFSRNTCRTESYWKNLSSVNPRGKIRGKPACCSISVYTGSIAIRE